VSSGSLDLSVERVPHHRRFFDEQLEPSLQVTAFAAFDASLLDPNVRHWALTAWQGRTLDEYRSQVAFTALLGELTSLDLPFDVLAGAVRVVRDEARHVELCRRLVRALGGSNRIPGAPNFVTPPLSWSVLRRALRGVAGSLCLGETVSAAILGATLKHTSDPLTHAVLELLTRDEAFHSDFGWRVLPVLWARAGERERAWHLRQLQLDLRQVERLLQAEPVDDRDHPRNPFGHLKRHERSAVFGAALKRVRSRFAKAGLALAPDAGST
jgi:hypothetical protein